MSIIGSIRPELPTIAKIRLGMKKMSSRGSLYPTTVSYFVLNCPYEPGTPKHARHQGYLDKVREVYGDTPDELDIFFAGNTIEAACSSYFGWWAGGGADRNGKVKNGELKCLGFGPKVNPDGMAVPSMATLYARRDKVTGMPAERECRGGPDCPDWCSPQGVQQCKPCMTLKFFLPRVTMEGVFEIQTHSWNSIRQIYGHLMWAYARSEGMLSKIPFKLARIETETRFGEQGQRKTGKQYILEAYPHPDCSGFRDQIPEGYLKELAILQKSPLLSIPMMAKDTFLLPPMGEDVSDVEALPEANTAEPVVSIVDAILNDAEVLELFSMLEEAMGKKFDKKARIIAIRKKENEADPKAAVIATIQEKIAELRAAAEPTPEPTEEPIAEDEPTEAAEVPDVTVEEQDQGLPPMDDDNSVM